MNAREIEQLAIQSVMQQTHDESPRRPFKANKTFSQRVRSYALGYMSGYKAALANAQGWIRVDETPPPRCTEILIWVPRKNFQMIASFDGVVWTDSVGQQHCVPVTHWMLKPYNPL